MGRGATRRKRRIDIFNVPTYVINMKERKDRWRRFTEQPAAGLFKRLRPSIGVNGKRLNYIKDRRISVRTRLNIFRNYRRSHYEIATLGAVGCSLSHVEAWKKFLASGSAVGLIMEDDAIITESILNDINEVIPSLPSGWGIWLLGCIPSTLVHTAHSKKPWERVFQFMASHAYLITRETAKLLLEDALPVETHIDHYMGSMVVLNDILMVHHPDIHIEFFRKGIVSGSSNRTIDSNTSQHKKTGCPTCDVPDDYSQIYGSPSRRGAKGMKVKGLVHGEQSRKLLTLRNAKTLKKRR